MAGRIALRAEILGRLHQAGAEIHLPVAVDGHARGQRMLRAEQPLRHAQPVGRGVLGHGRKHGGDAGRHLLAVIAIVAATQNEGVARLGHLRHHLRRHDIFLRLREPALEPIEFGIDAPQFRRGVVLEEVVEQPLILLLGALRLVLRQDVADGFVQRQRLGFGRCQRAAVNAQPADIALERLVVVRIADSHWLATGRTCGRPDRPVGPAAPRHPRGFAVQ